MISIIYPRSQDLNYNMYIALRQFVEAETIPMLPSEKHAIVEKAKTAIKEFEKSFKTTV